MNAAALRILVAEDHRATQELALLTLQRLGYAAELAANGLEVLDRLARQAYDVILMDVQMPEMDGLQATRRIVAQWPIEQRPYIVAVTAGVLSAQRLECDAAGMNDYLAKPFRLGELRQVLERAAAALQARRATAGPPPASGGIRSQDSLAGAWASAAAALSAAAAAPPAHPGPPPLLDPARLDELNALAAPGMPGLVARMIGLYLEELPETLAAVQAACVQAACVPANPAAPPNYPALKSAAHRLKGASLAVGALRLAAACLEIEQLAQAAAQNPPPPEDDWPTRLQALLRLAGETRAVFQQEQEQWAV